MPPETPFLLDCADPGSLTLRLRGLSLLDATESVTSLGSAGAGNMNLTLRARVGARSLVVKQSRPWVEKYPDIPAPGDRVLVEAAFYGAVAHDPVLAGAMPTLLALDPEARLMVLENLGEASDCSDVYAGASLDAGDRRALLQWLGALHRLPRPTAPLLRNRAMRALNHEHMVALPLRPAALDADAFFPGLEAHAARLRADSDYVAAVEGLGERYLADGDCLLHGDFYPGSWLRTDRGVRVIDPEFCFLGPAEFDVGVMLAHGLLAGGSVGSELAALQADYDALPGCSWSLVVQFAGMEVMRRLIGVAQLPLSADLERRATLLRWSRSLVLDPEGAL